MEGFEVGNKNVPYIEGMNASLRQLEDLLRRANMWLNVRDEIRDDISRTDEDEQEKEKLQHDLEEIYKRLTVAYAHADNAREEAEADRINEEKREQVSASSKELKSLFAELEDKYGYEHVPRVP